MTRLTGKAAAKLMFASAAEACSWESLQIFLADHFVPRTDVAMNLAQFQSRCQRPGESYIDYAGALRVILKRAFPDMSAEDREKMLSTQFTNGLSKWIFDSVRFDFSCGSNIFSMIMESSIVK